MDKPHLKPGDGVDTGQKFIVLGTDKTKFQKSLSDTTPGYYIVWMTSCCLEDDSKSSPLQRMKQMRTTVLPLLSTKVILLGPNLATWPRRPRNHHIGYTFWLPREVECQSGQS